MSLTPKQKKNLAIAKMVEEIGGGPGHISRQVRSHIRKVEKRKRKQFGVHP